MGWMALLGVLLAAAGQGDERANLTLPLLWQQPLHTFLESTATAADLDGDGRDEIIAAGREEIIVVDGGGKERWRWRATGRFMTYPAVLTDRDQGPRIYAADNGGQLTCLDAKGRRVWQAKLDGPTTWSAAVVTDLEKDGAFEVIQTDESGSVWCFDAAAGSVRWKVKVKGMPVSPAVADLTGDGIEDVVVTTGEGVIVGIDGAGNIAFEVTLGGTSPSWSTSSPIVFESGGSVRIVAASSEGRLACLDQFGALVWERTLRGAPASSLSAGDFDKDGLADIFAVTQLGTIHRFDENGRLLWDIDMQSRTLAPGALVDLDGDGRLEYFLSTQNGRMMALDQDGQVVFDHQFDCRTINVTPAFGEFDTKRRGLEFAITGGEAGILFCFGAPGAMKGGPWTLYRADVQNSGAVRISGTAEAGEQAGVQMRPVNLAWEQLCAGDAVRFEVTGGAKGRVLAAHADCVRPDGARQATTTRIIGERGELQLPLDVIAPGEYRFRWSVTDDRGWILASGERTLTLTPFANDRAVAARTLKAVESAAADLSETLPSSARALHREAVLLAKEIEEVRAAQEAATGSDEAAGTAVKMSAALTQRCRRLGRIAGVLRLAQPGSSLIVSEGELWESRGIDEHLPTVVANPLHVERRAVPGEHEPISLRLFNPTDRELLVRVVVDEADGGPAVSLLRSVGVPTAMGNIAWDALPELDAGELVTVPSFSSREVWVDLNFAGVTSGEHAVCLRFQSLTGAGVVGEVSAPQDVPSPENVVEIACRVLPFEMAPSGAFRLCTWAPSKDPYIDDLLAHGNNVFIAHLPEARYDGDKLAPSGFGKLEGVAKRLQGHDVILLLQGLPALRGEMESEAYRKDLKTYLDELVAYLAGYGFDTNHFALYPFDEPGGHGWELVNQLMAFGRAVKAVRPDVLMYVDGGGEKPMFEVMAECIDIWTPSIYQLPERSPEMDIMRTTGKWLWSYNCSYGYARPVGPNIKDINIVAEFRNAALFCLRYGAVGAGFWCYNSGPDPWGRIKDEYMLVYPGRDKPITSRRWEAVRESVEDYRILVALRERGANAIVQELLDVTLPAWIDRSVEEARQGLGREAIDRTNNSELVRAFRARMMEAVEGR